MTSLCAVAGCGKPSRSNGLCKTHDSRRRRGQPLDEPLRELWDGPRECSIGGCGRQYFCGGLCVAHYARKIRGMVIDAPMSPRRRGECSVDGCDRRGNHRGICDMHYFRQQNGIPLEAPRRTARPCITDGCARKSEADHGMCKSYRTAWQWRNDPEYATALRNRARWQRIREKYGFSKDQWLELYEKQKRSCACCAIELTIRQAHTDHCHVTGVVRGILCNDCNIAMGFLRDSVDRAEKAMQYLKRHQQLRLVPRKAG